MNFVTHIHTDKRRADETLKDRRSTDLFLKGLYLSFFENNDSINHALYHIDGDGTALKKRNVHQKSAISSSHFPAMRNYNKLAVDFSKLAQFDETRDSSSQNNNDDTKSTDKSVNNENLINPTLTFGAKAIQPTSTLKYHDNNNAQQSFLIQVY